MVEEVEVVASRCRCVLLRRELKHLGTGGDGDVRFLVEKKTSGGCRKDSSSTPRCTPGGLHAKAPPEIMKVAAAKERILAPSCEFSSTVARQL